ncbi:permease [Heliobacterium mobile]|nr:permease [Heliobacterium mobile]
MNFQLWMERLQLGALFFVASMLGIWTTPSFIAWGKEHILLTANTGLSSFLTIFLAITIEALPFVLIGVFGSALVEVFVNEKQLERWLPRNPWIGPLLAAMLGVIFPFCECGLVPVARRLLGKGARPSFVIPFMLAVPVVNPVTAMSTYYAFYGHVEFVSLRLAGAFIVAVAAGYGLAFLEKRYGKHPSYLAIDRNCLGMTSSSCRCGCGHTHHHEPCEEKPPWRSTLQHRLNSLMNHTCDEFFMTGMYLLLGAALAAAAQVWLPRALLQELGMNTSLSVFVMMFLAFALSVCSAADAFVGAGFLNVYPPGAVLAFLIFGPMVDVKNTMMMFSSFRRSFVIGLIFFVTLSCLLLGMVSSYFGQSF